MKPVQGIFERLKSFALTVGAGILANAALTWLQDEENQQKLMGIFDVLKEHWKWVLAGIGVFLALPLLGFVGGIVGTFAGLFPLLSPLLGVMVPLLPILAKAALIAGGLVLAGVAVKAAADKVRDEGFFGMGGTGGREFSEAHDKLNDQLSEAGLDRMGRTMGRGAQRPKITEEQIKIRDRVMAKKAELDALRDKMREERNAVVTEKTGVKTGGRDKGTAYSNKADRDKATEQKLSLIHI